MLSHSNKVISTIIKLQENFINKKPIHILFCDFQNLYMNKVYRCEEIKRTASYVAEASKILGLTQIITEHKKQIFGTTIKEIKDHYYDKTFVTEKTRFSMLDEKSLLYDDKDTVYILLGIEAHICVTQTALNILKLNKPLILLTDGISSVHRADREIALENIRSMGAYITTTQSLLFLLLQDSTHPMFKSLVHIFKDYSSKEKLILNAKF